MPYKEKEISKKYFSIGDVAKKINVKTSLIRFWENEFEILNPKKNKKGLRKYTDKDISILQKIYSLVKIDGFTLDGAKKSIKNDNNKKENQSIIDKLSNIKKRLISIKKEI
jgi:DNA-binding transcriptional MerR regulator